MSAVVSVLTAWRDRMKDPPPDATAKDVREASKIYGEARAALPGGDREEVYAEAIRMAEEHAARERTA